MELHIIRHAKTNQSSQSGQDIDRELLDRGHQQAKDLAEFLIKKNIGPTDIWVSMARRTQQTWAHLQDSFTSGYGIHHQSELYLCPKDILLKKIWSHHLTNEIVIVGHNFGISDLASYFLDERINLKTGEYMHLHFDCSTWAETSRGMATQVDQYRSKAV